MVGSASKGIAAFVGSIVLLFGVYFLCPGQDVEVFEVEDRRFERDEMRAQAEQVAKMRLEMMRMKLRLEELEANAVEPMDIPDRAEAPAFEEQVWRIIPPDSQVSDYGVTPSAAVAGSSSIVHYVSHTNPTEWALYNFKNPPDRRLDMDDFVQGQSNLLMVCQKISANCYVLTYTSLDGTNSDRYVAVGAGKTPGYLGLTDDSGTLRTSNLVYSLDQGATPPCVYMDHPDYGSPSDLAAGAAVVNSLTFDGDGLCHLIGYGTTNLTPSDVGVPDGTNNYDLLRWDSSAGEWFILLNDGDTYQVLQKKADGTVDYDYVRAH